MKSILAIIPAYNEAINIPALVPRLLNLGHDVLVIDDASTDRTYEEAIAAGAMVLRHAFNMGYAVTLQTGYKFALAHGYDLVVQLDGDNQHDPADSQVVLDPILRGEADMVIGSRFLGANEYHMSLIRMIGKSLFAWLIRIITGLRISDPTSGFQAMTKEVLNLYVSEFFADEYPDADMIILAHRLGFRITEVGVAMHQNVTGKSMHRGLVGPAYYIVRMMLGVLMACWLKPLRSKD